MPDTPLDPPPPAPDDLSGWLKELKSILRLKEEERALSLALARSEQTAKQDDARLLRESLQASVLTALVDQDRLIREAVERSLLEKATRDRERFEQLWPPLKLRSVAVLELKPVPGGLATLQEHLLELVEEVEQAARVDHERAIEAAGAVDGALPVIEEQAQIWRTGMESARLRLAKLLRRIELLEDSVQGVQGVSGIPAVQGHLQEAAERATQVEARLKELDPHAAGLELDRLTESVEKGEKALAAWRKRSDAYALRRKYVADRIVGLVGYTALDDAPKRLEAADKESSAGRAEEALLLLDQLVTAVRVEVRKVRKTLGERVEDAEFLPGLLPGKDHPEGKSPAAPADWKRVVELALDAWRLTSALALLRAFELDIEAARAALPREAFDLRDLERVREANRRFGLRQASTARAAEQVRAAALRMVGPDGTLKIDLGLLAELPMVGPDDLLHVRDEIAEQDTGLPQDEHALRMLRRIAKDKPGEGLRGKLEAISAPTDQDSPAARLIRATLGLKKGVAVTDAHARQAALSALLSQVRQGAVGSCFATACASMVQRAHPEHLLDDLKELIATGELKRTIQGKVLTAKLHEDQVESSFERTVEVPRTGGELGLDPGLQAALFAVGVPLDKVEAEVGRAAADLRFEEALKAAVEQLKTAPFDAPARKLLLEDALKRMRAMKTPDPLAALGEAIDAWSSAETPARLDPSRRKEVGTTVSDTMKPKLDPSLSDKRGVEALLRRAVELNTKDPDKAWPDAKDAFLGQEDNRLMRAWEYSVAGLVEHGDQSSRKRLQGGTGDTFRLALVATLKTIGSSFDGPTWNLYLGTIDELARLFREQAALIETRYDPNVPGKTAGDGSSNRGGFVLFWNGEKVQSEEQYTTMLQAIVEVCRKALAGTAHKDRSNALCVGVAVEVGTERFRNAVLKGCGGADDMKKPWAVYAGGDTDFMQQVYWGKDTALSRASSLTWGASKPGPDDGGRLARFLVDSVKAVGAPVKHLDQDPDGINKGMPLRAVGLHAVTLLPGAPLFQKAINGTKSTDEVVREFEDDEALRNGVRTGRALSREQKLAFLRAETGGHAEKVLGWMESNSRPHDTIQELVDSLKELKRIMSANTASEGRKAALGLSALQPSGPSELSARGSRLATPGLRGAVYSELLPRGPSGMQMRSELELALGSTADLITVIHAVSDRSLLPKIDERMRAGLKLGDDDPLDDTTRDEMVGAALGPDSHGIRAEVDRRLKAALPSSPKVSDALGLLPDIVRDAQRDAFAKRALSAPEAAVLDRSKVEAVVGEFFKGKPEDLRKEILVDVLKSPAPPDVPSLLGKIEKLYTERQLRTLEGTLSKELMRPEYAVLATAELDEAVDRMLRRLGHAGEEAKRIREAAKGRLKGAHHPIEAVQAAVKAAIEEVTGAVRLSDPALLRRLVEQAVEAAKVPAPRRKATAERAFGLLSTRLPADAKAVRDHVERAALLEALGASIDQALVAAAVPEGSRFAIRHQALLKLEGSLPATKAAVRDRVLEEAERQGVRGDSPVGLELKKQLPGGTGVQDGVPDPLDLGRALEGARTGFDEALTVQAHRAVPPPGAVFADTNWGNGDTMMMFTYVVNPVTGAKEVWSVDASGTGARPMDQDQWVKGREWRLFDDPRDYGGIG